MWLCLLCVRPSKHLAVYTGALCFWPCITNKDRVIGTLKRPWWAAELGLGSNPCQWGASLYSQFYLSENAPPICTRLVLSPLECILPVPVIFPLSLFNHSNALQTSLFIKYWMCILRFLKFVLLWIWWVTQKILNSWFTSSSWFGNIHRPVSCSTLLQTSVSGTCHSLCESIPVGVRLERKLYVTPSVSHAHAQLP